MDTYKHDPMYKILDRWENQKKDNNGKHCHEQRNYFTSFILSVDGMLGNEALEILDNLSRLIVAKMD